MRIRLAILSLLFWVIYPISTLADEQTLPASPSGTISQANPDASQKAEPVKKEPALDEQPPATKNPSSAAADDGKKTMGNQGIPSTKSSEIGAASPVDGVKPQTSPTPTVQDRRWIIRTPPPTSKKAKSAPVKKVKWISDTQKKQCDADLERLSAAFLKARYYSIQGDSCACAEHADQFLNIYEKSRVACPDNFLENEGYSDRITRNMGWLKALGEKRCMGPTAAPEIQPQSTETHHPAEANASPGSRTEDLKNLSDKPLERSIETPSGEPAAIQR
ncbi:hypothetical protein [Desulfosarcina sp.]|uniref:hypothetical protein n=1 Tax=Desulfosarcina sp. TaxID=2027861 RepID=UPI0035644705